MTSAKPLELDVDQLNALKQRVQSGRLSDDDSRIVQAVITTLIYLKNLLELKNISIKRLRKVLFGGKTEKLKNVLDAQDEKDEKDDDPGEPPPEDPNGPGKNPPDKTEGQPGPKPRKRKGHGRNAADAYPGANRKPIDHPCLRHGDPCPECPKGKIYEQKEPGTIIRFRGSAPVQATIYELAKLRCNLCGTIFTAPLPEEAGEQKYDESAKAIIALLKYGAGMPFYRLDKLQQSLGIPLADSTQWDLVEQMGNRVYPALGEFERQAAAGDVVYNDDTINKIIDLLKENQTREEGERTGIFTTGIVSTTQGRKIAIFYTGRRHAGENLDVVLKNRDPAKGPPIQMSDALSRNVPKTFDTILANCLTHGRRQFVDVIECFPDECRRVIETLAKVYKNDAIAAQRHMSAEERLAFHRKESGPLMTDLKTWFNEQFKQKQVEPNSGLGKAISYMLNHWDKLTRFLSVAGAPLDNNICERALKMTILHRKNALFFRSEFGAYIGDMFMSIIHTCQLMKVNPFDYLVALQKYSAHLFKNPSQWMPWNFEDTIASIET